MSARRASIDKLCWIAEVGDRQSRHVLHGEVGPAVLAGAGIDHAGDVGMIHERERLALGLEAAHDLPGVHPDLDDLERDQPSNRRPLFGEIHHAHAAFSERTDDLIGPYLVWQRLEFRVDGGL
jgi:hypothetical protein